MSLPKLTAPCFAKGEYRKKMLEMDTYQIVRKERKSKKTGNVTSYYWAEGVSDKCQSHVLQRSVKKDVAMEWQKITGQEIKFSPTNPENQKLRKEKQERKKARREKKKEAEKEKKRKEKEKAKKMVK